MSDQPKWIKNYMPILRIRTLHALATFCCLCMSLVFSAAGCRQSSTEDSTVVETEPTWDELSWERTVTEFAFRKNMLGMTRQDIESEIGVGEIWSIQYEGEGDAAQYSHPMLYDASLTIFYLNDRAVTIEIYGDYESDESPDWYYVEK